MRHPFEGIILADSLGAADASRSGELKRESNPSANRRTFLQRVGALIATAGGAFALSPRAFAQVAPRNEPRPRGERSGQQEADDTRYREDPVTTQALNEEGGGDYTTQALHEEGGRNDRYTTYALGEEGAQSHEPPRYTTYALGEEGAFRDRDYWRDRYYPPNYYPYRWYWGGNRGRSYQRNRYTTQALGEEGGWY